LKQRLSCFLPVVLFVSLQLTAQIPRSNRVVVVLEENHSYSSVIGNRNMPYLNSLASRYAVATQFYANTHPSIGNYFELTTGQIITNNDSFTSTVTADNMVRHMLTAAKTWHSYAESLPSVGYVGASDGWRDLRDNFRLDWRFDRAEDGNVAAIGRIDAGASGVAVSNINNVVDASFGGEVASLQYANTNGNHTTLIGVGQTLRLSGAGGLMVGTETDNGTAQQVNTTMATMSPVPGIGHGK